MPDPEFAALKRALTLNIVEAKRHASGASVDFHFTLTNRGRATTKACLGPSRSVSYQSASSSGISASMIHHAGCMREFTIEAGAVMSWTETLEVPRPANGRVHVEIGVEIVNPRRCENWVGCASFDLESNQFEIL